MAANESIAAHAIVEDYGALVAASISIKEREVEIACACMQIGIVASVVGFVLRDRIELPECSSEAKEVVMLKHANQPHESRKESDVREIMAIAAELGETTSMPRIVEGHVLVSSEVVSSISSAVEPVIAPSVIESSGVRTVCHTIRFAPRIVCHR